MKRLVAILLITVALCASAGESYGQETQYLRIPHNFTLFVDGGMAIPVNPSIFNKAWKTTLPINAGFGWAPLAWLDINAVLGYTSFGLNTLEANRQISFAGNNTVEGGSIKTLRYLVTARFIAVPSHRANPFAEIGLGQHSTSAEDVVVVGTRVNTREPVRFVNSIPDVNGISINFGAGIQYVLNESWSAYTKFIWTIDQGEDFAPSDLLINRDGGEMPAGDGDGSQQFANVLVGLMIRF